MKTMRRLFLTAGTAGIIGLALPVPEGAGASTGETVEPATVVVAKLTGADSLNRTSRWNVYGTDLGQMFRYRGQLRFIFGDTFGPAATDHRNNTMARSTDTTLANGLEFDEYVTDRPRHARELLPVEDPEVDSVIPTYGLASGKRMFLHYMAVERWGEPGHWDVAYSGLASSDDEGRTWVEDRDVRWPEGSNFAQVAMLRRDGYVYLFGIPGGRSGGVKLARVPEWWLLDSRAYRYWTGSGWAKDEQRATTIVPAPVGELSVQWSNSHRKWLMTYLNDERDAVVLRSAETLHGPWSSERVLATALQYPQLYAPYLVPDQDEGRDVYFTMSRYDVYNVFLMRTRLVPL